MIYHIVMWNFKPEVEEDKKEAIKAEMEVETELSPDDAAAHLKSVFKKTPEGSYMYFSIQPDGFFG